MTNSVASNVDDRLTKILAWIAGVGGALTVGTLIWIGSSLVDLKVSMAEVKSQNQNASISAQEMASRLGRVEQQVNSMDNRLTAIEARQVKALQ